MTHRRTDSPVGSLDELLRYEDEPPARPPSPRAGWVWVATTVAYSVGLAGFIVLTARTLSIGLPFTVVFAVIFALLVLHRIVRAVAPQPFVTETVPPSGDDDAQRVRGAPDGAIAAAARWGTRLSWTQSDPERFARTVQPMLAELADERLRQRHGVTRASDPARARELLGDPLWTFLATPVTRSPTPREVAAFVAQLEAL